jgi:hypothetical protein
VKYAIRIPANDSLERNIAELPTRPMACPSHKPVVRCKSFLYQAASWKIARRMVADEVRLWLSGLAYNPGNPWRRLVLPKKIENWSLTSLQQRLVKTGGRLVKHARYYWLMLAESHLTRWLFGSMVRRIDVLAVASG